MSLLEKLRSDAMRGKWSEILKTYENESALRTVKITATGDTLLHMAVSNWEVEVVEKMVDLLLDEEKKCIRNNAVVIMVEGDGELNRDLNIALGAKNDEKNTPLHLAAITGNVKMCKKIGDTDPSLITRRNIMGETPLFLAALSGNREAFLWLHYLYERSHGASSTSFAHCIRDDHTTILHCTIEGGHIGLAIEIVHLYKDHLQEMMKPNKEGLSPLHHLASKPSAFESTTLPELPILLRLLYAHWRIEEKYRATTFDELQSQEAKNEESFLSKFLARVSFSLLLLPVLLLFSEEAFRRWLHRTPEMKKKHRWWQQIMTELLHHASDEDISQIIWRNTSEKPSLTLQTKETNESESTIETPLMIAVKNGVVEMVEKILELFPLTINDVNADGKNILLLAVEYRQTKVVRFLCKRKQLTGSLFRRVDKDGNNALHLAAGLGVGSDWLNPGEGGGTLQREISWFESVKISMPHDLLERYNRKMKTPEDVFRESHKELMKYAGEWVNKTSKACSVVSTLVVSVAFATRSNVPGGYEDDNGYAILRNKSHAFTAFRRSSFLALFFSLISTICFLSIVASSSQSAHSLGYDPSRFYFGVHFMFASIVCLWISFCAADFFMLHDNAQKLHKALPTYFLLTCGVILMVFLQLPIFLGPKFSRIQRFFRR